MIHEIRPGIMYVDLDRITTGGGDLPQTGAHEARHYAGFREPGGERPKWIAVHPVANQDRDAAGAGCAVSWPSHK